MARSLISVVLAIAGGGSAYFLVQYVLTRAQYRKIASSRVQRAYLAIEEAEMARRPSLDKRVKSKLRKAGWEGGPAPVLASVGFLYAVCTLVMFALGFPEVLGLVVGLPVCVGAVQLIMGRITARRKIAFQRQLMPALAMLAAQIEAGNGAERALEQILPSLEDPLGAELQKALSSTVTQELVPALQSIGERYPSRAFSLFIAALEIDRMQGGALAPALREASAMLERQFELLEETQAELSQAKMEFHVVAGIITAIAVYMLGQGEPLIREAYTSPVGVTALAIGFSWFGFGIYRALRLLRRSKGADQ